jgi:hypothetical protein
MELTEVTTSYNQRKTQQCSEFLQREIGVVSLWSIQVKRRENFNADFFYRCIYYCLVINISQRPIFCRRSGIWEPEPDKMNCELILTYDTPTLRQTGSRNLMGQKMLPTIWGTYMKLVTKYQISAINSGWEKCDKKWAYMFFLPLSVRPRYFSSHFSQ